MGEEIPKIEDLEKSPLAKKRILVGHYKEFSRQSNSSAETMLRSTEIDATIQQLDLGSAWRPCAPKYL